MKNIQHELELFKRQGFATFKNQLSSHEIQTMVSAVDRMLNNLNHSSDLLAIDESKKTHKILYPLNKEPSLLKYIVHPTILDILINMIDDISQIVLTWEDILIKEPYYGIPVTYHQDLALQSTKHDIFSFGIYLHDATDNPVYYLPESFNYGALTKEALYEIAEKEKDKFIALEAKAGDISMHYVKTIHYSNINTSPNPRYTWYLEYRTIQQLRENSPWDEEWIMQRRAIFVAALQKYAPAYLDRLAPDLEKLKPYLEELELRVPQTNETIQYDMDSPYNHFS